MQEFYFKKSALDEVLESNWGGKLEDREFPLWHLMTLKVGIAPGHDTRFGAVGNNSVAVGTSFNTFISSVSSPGQLRCDKFGNRIERFVLVLIY